jgi:hypothetical protein
MEQESVWTCIGKISEILVGLLGKSICEKVLGKIRHSSGRNASSVYSMYTDFSVVTV